jgi:prepilin-type N-terminal cleavage/methylation domain-containing protein
MASQRSQNGLTLVEIIIAVAIVAILAGLVFTTMTSIDNKAKEQLCEGTLETLNTALRQFSDFGYEYSVDTSLPSTQIEFYRSLKFPPDCNDYEKAAVEDEIENLVDSSGAIPVAIDTNGFTYEPDESGIAVMYFYLSQVPDCRETLAGLDTALVKSDHNNDGDYLTIKVDGTILKPVREYPWLRVVDPWGMPLRYDYYSNKEIENFGLTWTQREQTIRNFPLLTSAGPDRKFDTDDDITNRDKTKTPVP